MLVTLRVERIKYEAAVHRCSFYIHSLHLNISMHILYTVFHTFPKVLTWRICLPIKSFLS